ncbi:MAG: baseplate multidomain protein megatron [Rhizobiaceae bacterium]
MWPVWARDHQVPELAPWTNWLLLGGRGAGKTRAGAEWVRGMALGETFFTPQPVAQIALVAETYSDAREVMIEGQSGLLALHKRSERPQWISSRRRLEWPNGSVAQVFSSEDPDALRGPQFGAAWCDDFGYHPDDGSGNVYFNLDPLWAHPAISVVGIDNYMPISDWRRSGSPDGQGRMSTDQGMFSSGIVSGEGYDWFYRTAADREAGLRSTINDGLGKPWIYRYKDLKSWWTNQHFERRNGVELASSTAWIPQSKPILFTEIGCPAINNGAAQPNVFVDEKSSETALPYFSNGGRNDQMQAAFIEAHQAHWLGEDGTGSTTNNPVSEVYGSPMVDFERAQFWAWDARPYPVFPAATEIWSDAPNWQTGHWLNGRLGMVRLADLLAELLKANGVTGYDVSQVSGMFDGYLIADGASTRQALEVLISLYRLSVFEDAGQIVFRSAGRDAVTVIEEDDIVFDPNSARISITREQEVALPGSVELDHLDPDYDFQDTQSQATRNSITSLRKQAIAAPLVVNRGQARVLLSSWLHERWTSRDTVTFSLSRKHARLTVGDVIALKDEALAQTWRITGIESGERLDVTAKAVELGESLTSPEPGQIARVAANGAFGKPYSIFMDLPHLPLVDGEGGNCMAVSASPWPGTLSLYASQSQNSHTLQQALQNFGSTGELVTPLPGTASTSRWDRRSTVRVKLFQGVLHSQPQSTLLNGANALAVRSADGGWEVLQYANATLVAPQCWDLDLMLRGQAGTEIEARAGSEPGTQVAVLNSAVYNLQSEQALMGLQTNWLLGPAGQPLDSPGFSAQSFAPGYRRFQPLRPVHLKARLREGNKIDLNWVRRDRVNSDDWSPVDVPMSEGQLKFQITATSPLFGELTRTVGASSAHITSSDLTAAFGGMPTSVVISVSQLSDIVGAGPSAITTVQLS